MYFVIDSKITELETHYSRSITGALCLYVTAQVFKVDKMGASEPWGRVRSIGVKYFDGDSTVAEVLNFIDSMFERHFVTECFCETVADMANEIHCVLPWEALKNKLIDIVAKDGRTGDEIELWEIPYFYWE